MSNIERRTQIHAYMPGTDNPGLKSSLCEAQILTTAMHYVDTNSVQKGIDLSDIYVRSSATIQGVPSVYIGNYTNKSDLAIKTPYSKANLSQQGDYAQAIFKVASECNTTDGNGKPALALTLAYDGGKDNQTYSLIVSNRGTKIHLEGVSVTDPNIIAQVLRQTKVESVGVKIDEIIKKITGKELEGANKNRLTEQDARKALQEYYNKITAPQPTPEAKVTPTTRAVVSQSRTDGEKESPVIEVRNSPVPSAAPNLPVTGTELTLGIVALGLVGLAIRKKWHSRILSRIRRRRATVVSPATPTAGPTTPAPGPITPP